MTIMPKNKPLESRCPRGRIFAVSFLLLPCFLFAVLLSSSAAANAATFSGISKKNGLNAPKGKIKIEVEGYVSKPGVYELKKGARLSSLLFNIWPLKKGAYEKGAFLSGKSRRIEQRVILKGLLRDILRLLNRQDYAHRHSPNRLHYRAIENRIKKRFKTLKPTGRITGIVVKNPILLMNTKYDAKLKNGDKLLIPSKPKYVDVEGAVKKQGSFKYGKGKPAGYYIGLAGGTAERSAQGHYYLLKVNGTVEKINTRFIVWNRAKKRWEFAFFEKQPPLSAGDIVFIPYNYGSITGGLTRLILAVYKRTGRILNYNPANFR